jgi:hypothetical protein
MTLTDRVMEQLGEGLAPEMHACPGCGEPTCRPEYCGDCEPIALEIDDRWERYRKVAAAAGKRLETCALAGAAVGLFLWIARQFRGWLTQCLDLWFGGR